MCERYEIKNGIDMMLEYSQLFEGKRLGLITNPTGVNKNFQSAVDILNQYFQLTTLYSPEHGVRGNIKAGEEFSDYIDERTNIPVISLYGKNKKPSAEALENVDALVFDIQDIGVRFYTYIYTLAYCMQAAAENNKKVIVLDRVNPLSGGAVEGMLLEPAFSSFVGLYPIPARFGLTVGEFAGYINKEFHIHADLEVVKIQNWNRNMIFPETDLCFIPPSPNIPTFESALAFIGTCFFEGTNVSEGRGTTRPFETIGAPFIDAEQLAYDMNSKSLPGVKFSTAYFEPTCSKYEKQLCSGVLIHVTDARAIKPYEMGVNLLYEVKKNKEFQWTPPLNEGGHYFADLIAGTDKIRLNKLSATEVIQKAAQDSRNFAEKSKLYYLYTT